MSIKGFVVPEQRGDKMGIGKDISDFLGAFAESALGSDSKGAGVPTGSGDSKSSDSRGGNSGSSSVDSAGITETRDSWGNPISHSVRSGNTDKIYPVGMMGWIESLTGGQPVSTIERVGDHSTYKDSDGDTIASGIRQSDGSERVYTSDGTFIRTVTPVETHDFPCSDKVEQAEDKIGNDIDDKPESEAIDGYFKQQNSREVEDKEMAQIATCGACKGSGSCSRCAGVGQIKEYCESVLEKCPDCHGEGYKKLGRNFKSQCEKCDGTGQRWKWIECPRCGGNCECTGCKGSGHIVAQDIINHYHQEPQEPRGNRW